MKKRKCEVWLSQVKRLFHAMHFSALDKETQTCVNHEFFYFNHRRFMIIAWVVIVLELLNLVNVLFFSDSGLTTPNNRQYFTMYLLLLVSGIACLRLQHLLRKKTVILARCYIGFTAFWLAWHAILSAMDLRRNPSITVFISGIFGLSLLVWLKPREALSIMPASFILLLICARNYITSGIAVNAFIVTLVAMLISCSRYVSTLEELGYRKKMILQADHRAKEQQTIKQLEEQQQALLQHSQELLFLWDKERDRLLLAGDSLLCDSDEKALQTWLLKCKKRNKGQISLQLMQHDHMGEYKVSCTPILDSYGDLTGAAGCLEPMEHKVFMKPEES